MGAARAGTGREGRALFSGRESGRYGRAPQPLVMIKQIDAGVLSVGYAESGPSNGRPVILVHGWPYDIHSFDDATPLLTKAGYRVIAPYVRGYGSTRFLSADTVRNGQQAVLGADVIALMEALKIDKAVLAGFDWGGRSADIV